jgi:AhpD family alkylhydroperoxidase
MPPRLNHYAASPAGMKALAVAHAHVRQSQLPARLVDLVFLRVSQINGCAFCIDSHAHDLLEGGMPIEQLVLVSTWSEAGGLFSEQERAALAWAEAVTRLGDGGVSDGAFASARAAFDDRMLTDLTIAVGLMSAYNRIAISFRATPAAVARANSRDAKAQVS